MYGLVILLAGGLLLFIVMRILLLREIRAMNRIMKKNQESGASRQLTIGTRNKDVAALAASINALYGRQQDVQAEYIKKNEELRQNMADISHDLRTPLTGLIGYLKLLKKEKNPEIRETYLNISGEKAEMLHQLVTSLFDLARLEAGNYPFLTEEIDFRGVLEQELASFYPQFSEQDRQAEFECEHGRMSVMGDYAALRRVLENLIQNALIHGQGNIYLQVGREGNKVYAVIANLAAELKQEDIPHLFRRSYKADRHRASYGSGLGLTIVKEFMEQMGGGAWAQLADQTLRIGIWLPEKS